MPKQTEKCHVGHAPKGEGDPAHLLLLLLLLLLLCRLDKSIGEHLGKLLQHLCLRLAASEIQSRR